MSECLPCLARDCGGTSSAPGDVLDPYSLYSLQTQIYPVVIPLGALQNILAGTVLSYVCTLTASRLDQVITRVVPSGATPADILALFSSMYMECAMDGVFVAASGVGGGYLPPNLPRLVPPAPPKPAPTTPPRVPPQHFTPRRPPQTVVWKWPTPKPQVRFYGNAATSCTVYCQDGTPTTFAVASNQFYSPSQAGANAYAKAYACQQAKTKMKCYVTLGELDQTQACLNSPYSGIIQAGGNTAMPMTWDLTGSLPTGLTGVGQGANYTISGTVTAAGTYSFSLTATNNYGESKTRSYTITVVTITTASLPDASANRAYTATLVASPVFANQLWSSSPLPSGLTLDHQTGALTGTPDFSNLASPDGKYYKNFTIVFTIQDSDIGIACSKTLTLKVKAPDLDFGDMQWSGGQTAHNMGTVAPGCPNAGNTNSGSATGSGNAGGFSMTGSVSWANQSCHQCAGGEYPTVGIADVSAVVAGTMKYMGPARSCNFHSVFLISLYGITSGHQWSALGGAFVSYAVGTHDYGFNVPECLTPTDITFAANLNGVGAVAPPPGDPSNCLTYATSGSGNAGVNGTLTAI